MHVGRLVTRPVETCTVDENAATLASRMQHRHVGNLVVIEYRNGEAVPIGIVTDRDLVTSVMAPKLDPERVTAGQIMSHGLIVAAESDDVTVALDEMRRSGVRRLPVVDDGGRLTGIVALDDVMEYFASILVDVSRIGRVQQIEEQRTHA
ncbi:CBS domain-containing protein [Paraburkholderia sp. NMBU_R16]|uniref:CBS domain-containing protein n=1 Tax=Paraburkholderia sp. NMBU_R16 TaxID=2698676 RepID=UPI001566A377|nr:CBS domain-containing protein [Paraburkholderia sp. NMBU_R16]NRO96971.1 CBS domain-containing protein [Paraburkholderia sp. NMBU_R16]